MCVISNGCLFIHNTKTAGTSIRSALMSLPNSMFCSRSEDSWQPHLKPRELRQILGPPYESLTSFVFVRHPCDWFVSMFEFCKRNQKHELYPTANRLGFRDFCVYIMHRRLWNQDDFADRHIVDHIFKFEEIDKAWEKIQKMVEHDVPLPKHNVSIHPHWKTYYEVSGWGWRKDLIASIKDYNPEVIERYYNDDDIWSVS